MNDDPQNDEKPDLADQIMYWVTCRILLTLVLMMFGGFMYIAILAGLCGC